MSYTTLTIYSRSWPQLLLCKMGLTIYLPRRNVLRTPYANPHQAFVRAQEAVTSYRSWCPAPSLSNYSPREHLKVLFYSNQILTVTNMRDTHSSVDTRPFHRTERGVGDVWWRSSHFGFAQDKCEAAAGY